MQVDLADDRFDITHDPKRVAVAELLGVIRELEYEAEVVERAASVGRGVVDRIDVAELPAELADLFAEARKSGKTVLVRISGPG